VSALSSNGLSVRRYDRDRFVTALFAAPERREDLFTLYAFNLEIARIRETVREPMLGQIRLQWWRDNLGNGRAIGHPVGEAINKLDLPRPLLDRLIDARELDMQDRPPQSAQELMAYIEDSAGGLCQLAALILGGGDNASQEAARQVGQAWGLLGLMRARKFLPDEDPKHLAEHVEQHLRAARALKVAKAARPALLVARLADHYLKALRAADYDLENRQWSRINTRPLSLLLSHALGKF
jgi:NADH dehydrogenase [ubiquinone] 1 alpha subcomplex assembly factor 6